VPTIRATAQHAGVRCKAHARQRLEQLCRYITRPALANERVQINAAGQVVLTLQKPCRGGTTHIVMSPLELMQRLAALVPRPRAAASDSLLNFEIRKILFHAGSDVQLHTAKDMSHGYLRQCLVVPAAREHVRQATDSLARHLAIAKV